MQTTKSPGKLNQILQAVRIGRLAGWLVLATQLFCCFIIALETYSFYDEEGGPFYLSAQPADLDLDGDLDMLVNNMRNPKEFLTWAGVAMWTNQGGLQGGLIGRFEYLGADLGGWPSTLADLDGDGDLDALAFDGARLVMSYNQGGVQAGKPGVFKMWATIPGPKMDVGEYGVLLAGDVDGDGRPDALLLGRGQSFDTTPDRSYRANVSWIWLNKINSHGVYFKENTLIEALNGLSVAAAALGDLDGDGDLDLLVAASPTEQKSMNGSTSLVLLNDGAGNFHESGQRLPAKRASSLALGDLDGDGDPDALVGYARGALILVNQGGAQAGQPGAFALAEQEIKASRTHGVNLADLDNDGDLDALLAGRREAELWWNDGRGQFSRSEQSFPSGEDQNLATGDFNNDGWVDIFITQYNQTARIWRNDGRGGFKKY